MTMAEARLKKDEVVKIYSGIAPLYDLWGTLTETHARRKALEFAKIRDGEAILEVALGTGLTFREILKANPSGTAVRASEKLWMVSASSATLLLIMTTPTWKIAVTSNATSETLTAQIPRSVARALSRAASWCPWEWGMIACLIFVQNPSCEWS